MPDYAGGGSDSARAPGTRTEIIAPGLNPPISHYVDAVRFGDLLFVSGCGPVDTDLNVVGGDDPAEQTRQVLRNLEAILHAAGAGLDDVLKVTVYLTDIDDRELINPVRQEFFKDVRPASTLVEVSRLAIDGMRVEIDAVAGMRPT